MNNSLLQAVFGCTHRKTTFPLTPIRARGIAARSATETKAQTYIACLDCGKELPYDWERMRRINTSFRAVPLQALRRMVVHLTVSSLSE